MSQRLFVTLDLLVLSRIFEISDKPWALALSCRILYDLWTKQPSLRVAWLLKRSSDPLEAIEKACLVYNDPELTVILLRITGAAISDLWKAHILIDLCRTSPSPTHTTTILHKDKRLKNIHLLLHACETEADITLYLKALMFVDHPYKLHLMWLLDEAEIGVSVFDACLFFSTLQGFDGIVLELCGMGKSLALASRPFWYAFCMACQSGQKELAATLLNQYPSLRNENLDLPFQFALRNGHESLASLFNELPPES